jgi:type IV pilus assembly protein PilW
MMVALTLSLIIMGGVIQIFISNKATYRMNEAMSRVQENGRFATMFLTQDIRMAGFQGCGITGNLTNGLNTDCSSSTDYCGADNFEVGIEGFNNVSGNIAITDSISITPHTGTDVIVIRKSADTGVSIERDNSSGNIFATVTSVEVNGCGTNVDKISGICPGDILLVSDCSKSRLFQASTINESSTNPCTATDKCANITHAATGTPGNASPVSWGASATDEEENFGADASIFKMATYYYYIATGSSGAPALFRKDGRDTSQELVEGIEDMQILYGEDTDATADGVANRYVDAGTVMDWDKVVSARITLLLRTIDDNVASEVITYNYNGNTNITPSPSDKRLRRVFTTTIGIRNRIL